MKPFKSVTVKAKFIAYTFDDGPKTELTERFLDFFKSESIKVTFFNTGKNLKAHSELAKLVLAKGHEIGNHTVRHLNLKKIKSQDELFAEINNFQLLARKVLGYRPVLFRAPYLAYDERVFNVLSKLNLTPVNANVFSNDASPESVPDSIINRVLNTVRPGSIILSHERENTLIALKTIIPELKKRGYHFVTVSELLTLKSAEKLISPGDNRIHFSGAKYSKVSNGMIDFQRHCDSLLALPIKSILFNTQRAKTTTGVVLSFKTSSPFIKVGFVKLPGEHRNGIFSIFQDGTESGTQAISAADDSIITILIQPLVPNIETVYEIVLPTWNNLAFTGLKIDPAYDLEDYKPPTKKIYVAYGNSITHGTGQKGTAETYAFKVARIFGWELYNVAVGGAKTSVAIADMLRDDFERIDYLTILIGYNDYKGEGVDTITYKNRYESVLRSIREKHKNTVIFCITQTYTTQCTSKVSGIPISDFRNVVVNLVNKLRNEGDENIYLIRGEEITCETNLEDDVHFTVDGAAEFADLLSRIINNLL